MHRWYSDLPLNLAGRTAKVFSISGQVNSKQPEPEPEPALLYRSRQQLPQPGANKFSLNLNAPSDERDER